MPATRTLRPARPLLFLPLLILLGWAATPALAQDIEITGKVVDNTKDHFPIPFAYVIPKGTPARGTQTDFNGNYKLKVPAGETTLIFRFIGYVTQEVAITARTSINVTLAEEVSAREEVVITGYKTEKKVESVANIATIKGEAFATNPAPSFDAALQGRASGVQVTQSTGLAGAGVSIKVRGSGSISAASEPLYIIDGVPVISGAGGDGGGSVGGSPAGYQLNALADFNPADIETLEILKDAAATAQYGSRGSNGVVVITTKKGRSGKTRFNASYYTGVESVTNKVDVLNSEQYINTIREAYYNSFRANPQNVMLGRRAPTLSRYLTVPSVQLDSGTASNTNVNYLDYILQTGRIDEASVGASGGDAKTNFYVNGTFRQSTPPLLGAKYERVAGKFNINSIVSSRFKVSLSTNVIYSTNQQVPTGSGNSGLGGFGAAQYRSLPIFPVFTQGTNSSFPFNPYFNAYQTFAGTNIYLTQDQNYASLRREVFRNISNLALEYVIIPRLVYRAELGLDYYSSTDRAFQSRFLRQSSFVANQPTGAASDSRNYFQNFNLNQILSYTKDLDEKSRIEGTAVQNYQTTSNFSNFVQAEDFPNDDATSVSAARRQIGRGSDESHYRFLSGMLIGKYGFKERYFFQASARYEGSSRFGANNRFGLFPSAAVNWIASDEAFMQRFEKLSLLKFRASFGITGNAAGIGNYQSLGLYRTTQSYNLYPGTAPSQIANPNLTYEKARQFDISMDVGLFQNRIELNLTYFNKNSYDLLLGLPVPPSQGVPGTFFTNAGQLSNRGWEITLNTKNLVKAVRWTTDFNISFITNELQSLAGLRYNEIAGTPNIGNFVGRQLSTFLLPEYAGVNEKGEELIYRAERDANGQITGRRTEEKIRVTRVNQLDSNRVAQFNKPIQPKFYGGMTNTVSYKGFDLSVLATFQYGNWVLDDGERLQSYVASQGVSNNLRTSAIAEGHPTLYYSSAPGVYQLGDIIENNGYTINDPMRLRATTRFLHDASFIRVKAVTLGYTFPKSVTSKIYLDNLRIYVSATNLLTFTKFPGWDPEVVGNLQSSQDRNLQQGITSLDFPQTKTFTAGIQVAF